VVSGHEQFEELAAGYALDALEPADEQAFLRHAATCPDCTQVLAGFREVAAAIAGVAPAAEPRADLGDRILVSILGDQDVALPPPARDEAAPAGTPAAEYPAAPGAPPAPATGPGQSGDTAPESLPPGVTQLRPRSRRWLRPASVAAAIVVIAGGVWGGLAATGSGHGLTEPTVASCQQQSSCHEITLTAAGTDRVEGKVLVQNGTVWMLTTGIRANDIATQIYVLWQIAGQAPQAVGGFDVHSGTSGAELRIGKLPASFPGTREFAVTLEHGRSIPPSPSTPIATGVVS